MRKLLLITLSVLTYATTYAQNITTIAGGLGDGGPAINTHLNNPYGTAVDGSGNIYIADTDNNRIRKVTASTGIISTVAGNGTQGYEGDGSAATSANLYYPTGVAVDDSGNIYIADQYNHRIRKVNAFTGIINTVAGNGTRAFGGDDSAATSANLNTPYGVAVDNSGNIYIADQYNHRIRKVTASTGIISTVAGNGTQGYGGDGNTSTSASLYNPWGVAIDGSGNIYIADRYNNRIRKVNVSNGIISTIVGNGIYGYGGDGGAATSANLSNPSGVAIDGSGNIYIADANNHRIRKVTTSTGVISTLAGNGTAAYGGDSSTANTANLYYPSSIAIDGSGNIYMADRYNNRIRKVTASTGVINTVAGNGAFRYGGDGSLATSASIYNPSGVAVDGSGNIYIADQFNNRIRKVSASTGIISTVAGNGTQGYGGDGSTATFASLNTPNGVAIDSSGNIYIADTDNNRIRKVTASTGIISTVAGNGIGSYGGDGSAPTSANIYNPTGVAIDGTGNIYIADYYNHRIRKVTASTGIISTVAGNGKIGSGGNGSAATSANLSNPSGVAIDASGNIYIADAGNHWIRKVTASTGVISTVVGNGTAAYGGDSNTATSANLNYPYGVTLDGSGNIYIADVNNNRIRKVTTSTGIINTVAGNGIWGYGGDGNAATLANLYYPSGVAVDGSGNIYIADAGNSRIRKVRIAIGNNIISNSQTICAGSAPAILTGSTPISDTSSFTYSWLSSTTSATAGFTAIPSTNTINYSPGALTQNTWFRRYVVSGALTDTSAAVAIMVNNATANNTITSIAQTICSGNIPSPITASTATGGNGTSYNYKWSKSTTSATAGFANAGGNDSTQNFTSGALTQNTWFKRRVSSGVCNADTTSALLVTIKPTSTSTNIISICPNLLPFIWNSRTYNSNKTDTIYLTNSVGCDSITILKLTIKPTSTSTNIISICPSLLPFIWNGRTYNSNRTDTVYLINSVGCDSITILKLTIKPSSSSISNISICSNELPFTWNSKVYNSAVIDTVILTNAASCDSITILNLIVKPTSSSTNNISICPSSLPYTWNGLLFSAAGTQTKTGLTNSVGCDSSATLNLTVKSTSTSTNNMSICPSALPYTWNGLIFNAAGTQTKTGLTNSIGCDSSATLILTVNPMPSTSNITGLTNIARLDTASYSVTGTSGSVFNWVTTRGLVQTGANTNQIQVKWNAIGMDTLKVTETSNQGCVGSQKTLLVNIGPATGMNEINASNSILVYPNPFNETIFISLLNNSGLNKAILFDLLGKEILTTHKSEIDVKELKSGVYLIMVIDNNGNSYSQKLIKN